MGDLNSGDGFHKGSFGCQVGVIILEGYLSFMAFTGTF